VMMCNLWPLPACGVVQAPAPGTRFKKVIATATHPLHFRFHS
jgi:hypothetical protein